MMSLSGRLVAALSALSIVQACDSSNAAATSAKRTSAFDQVASANRGDGERKPVSYGFARLSLDRGVSVDIPKSFRILTTSERELIRTAGSAAVEQTGMTPSLGQNLIRANSTPASSYGAISITSAIPPSISYQEARGLKQSDVAGLNGMMRQQMARGLSAIGMPLLSFYGVKADHFGNYPALVEEYERSAPDGRAVVVQVNSIFTPAQEVRLTLSYRKSEAPLWRPILARVRSSLVVE